MIRSIAHAFIFLSLSFARDRSVSHPFSSMYSRHLRSNSHCCLLLPPGLPDFPLTNIAFSCLYWKWWALLPIWQRDPYSGRGN